MATASLLALACVALIMPATASATDWTKLRTLNITHQGGEDEAPSATMYAFERSMKLGSDMLEVDVNVTEDDKLAIIHDGSLDRTTNGTGPVANKTMAEIKKLDAAHWFAPMEGTTTEAPESEYVFRGVRLGNKRPPVGYKAADFRPLELDELMQRYPDVPINIEIKGGEAETDATYDKVARVLAAYLNDLGRTDGIMVASFNDAAMDRFHDLAPQIDIAPAVAGVAGYVLADIPPPPGTAAFQVPTSFSGIPITTPEFVERAHSDGYGVHVWTINDEETMNELFDMGVDGIMTAEPMRLEHVMCERGEKRPKLPKSTGGKHCSEDVSIACDVEPTSLKRKGKQAIVRLTRNDTYDSRCAGRVGIKVKGSKKRKAADFDFGWEAGDGPETLKARIKLPKRMSKALKKKRQATVKAYPFDAFLQKKKLRTG